MVTITLLSHVRGIIEGEFDAKALDDHLSFHKGKFWFRSPAVRKGLWDGKTHMFHLNSGTFPLGLLKTIESWLVEKKVEYKVVDERETPEARNRKVVPRLEGVTLRGDQCKAIRKAAKAGRGIIHGATGSGKTELAIALTKRFGMPVTLFVTGRTKLARQTRERFAKRLGLPVKDIGLIQGGTWEYGDSGIFVAVVNSLVLKKYQKARGDLYKACELLFIDECFPAGTIVEGKKIETIKVGDVVSAVDPDTGRIVPKRVTRRFVRPATQLVRVRTKAGAVTCTPNHPFFTPRGWVPAVSLDTSDMVWYATGHDHHVMYQMRKRRNEGKKTSDGSMQCVPEGAKRQDTTVRTDGMHRLWNLSDAVWRGAIEVPISWASILLRGVLRRVQTLHLFYDNVRDQSEVRCRTDADKQPNVATELPKENDWHAEKNRPQTPYSRWERSATTKTPRPARSGTRLENRSDGADGPTPALLQDRHSEPPLQSGNRGGWEHTRGEESKEAGQRERRFLTWVGVDGVEILQPGRDGEVGDLCPDGKVYNLEIEDLHTYIANGFVVHNCHHLGATTWYRTLMNCKAPYRFGLTGTPIGRSDSGDLYLRACTGDVVSRIRSKDLIDAGVLARPTIYFTRILRPLVTDIGNDWEYIYKRGIVANDVRNGTIIDYATQLQSLGKTTLILVREIEHGKTIVDGLSNAAFISGKDDASTIDQAFKDIESGEIKTLVATTICDEGIDLPNVNVLIIASGGKSVITTLQRIGRGLRRKEKDNRVFVFDFDDRTNAYLAQHSKARIGICRGEGFNTTVLRRACKLDKLVA